MTHHDVLPDCCSFVGPTGYPIDMTVLMQRCSALHARLNSRMIPCKAVNTWSADHAMPAFCSLIAITAGDRETRRSSRSKPGPGLECRLENRPIVTCLT